MNKTIIVLGQSRSGTTAVMNVLYHLDINIGILFKKTEMNKNGSFEELSVGNCLWRQERRMFPETNDSISKSKDKYFYEIKNKNDYELLRKEFKVAIQRRAKTNKDWAFKNPVFVHQWQVLIDLIDNPYFIVIKRNLESNALSLSKWIEHDYEICEEIVKFRDQLINDFLEKYQGNKLLIGYENLLKNSYETVEEIAKFIGTEYEEKAKVSIQSELRNF